MIILLNLISLNNNIAQFDDRAVRRPCGATIAGHDRAARRLRDTTARTGKNLILDEALRGGMTVIHIILMAPYIQTNNEELYLYNNDVTYYVITCNSAFEYNNDVTYYVITRNYQWTPAGDPHK